MGIKRALHYLGTYLKVAPRRMAMALRSSHPEVGRHIKSVSETWGIPFRAIRVGANLDPLVGVFVLVDSTSHDAYVLIRDGRESTLWHAGTETYVREVLCEVASLQGYQFYGVLPEKRIRISTYFFQAISGFWREKSLVFLGGLLVFVFGLIFSKSVQYLLDNLIPQGHLGGLFEMLIWLFGMVIGMIIFQWIRVLSVVRWTLVAKERLSGLVLWRVLHLRLAFFRSMSVGDLLYRLQSAGDVIQFFKTSIFSMLFSGIFSILTVMILGLYSIDLLMKIMLILGPFLIVFCVGIVVQYRFFTDLQMVSGRYSAFALQLVTGISKLKLAHAQDRFFEMWYHLFLDKLTAQYRYRWLKEIQMLFFTLLPTLIIFSLLLYIDGSHLTGAVTVGSFLFLVMFLTQWAVALGGLFCVFSEAVVPVLTLLGRLRPILEADPEVVTMRTVLKDVTGQIEVAEVSFDYDNGVTLLSDISFVVPAGQFVAIVGPSGCGKSTLLNVLMGFDTPKTGAVYYDDTPLGEVDLIQLRRTFGVVLQDGVLFPGDILSNIIGGLPLGIEDAWAAARVAGIAAEIDAMPMGIHTILTDAGSSLSGGQRQRLMLARALVHQPKILFLDEATSALDNVMQAQITASLNQLQLTRIVVAHRLSTIEKADLILVMDRGRIVQQGTYESLIAVEGLFQRLASRQIV